VVAGRAPPDGQSPVATQPRTPYVIVPDFHLAYSRTQVKNSTETLEIGTRAPDFSLGAANREGTFTLGELLAQGKLILEFLRGTW
jgi:hypothetical protein